MTEEPQPHFKHVWVRRAAYIAVALAVFVMMPLTLVILADVTGVINFRDIFGPLVFWNELSGPSFVLGFFTIIILVAIMVFFILKAFDTTEGAW